MQKTLKKYVDEYLKNNKCANIKDVLRVAKRALNLQGEFVNLNDEILSSSDELSLNKFLNMLYVKNIPLQYILGYQNFYNEKYIVTPAVLIPRADTEILVETAIRYITLEKHETLLDMCTGSGAVGISIAKNSRIKECALVDISFDALEVAKKNIELNNAKNCQLIQSNLFENISKYRYDILVSNPPYIKTSAIASLDKEVQSEPKLALDGGENGTYFYQEILEQAKKYLKDNSIIIFEIGYDQKQDLIQLISNHKEYEYLEYIKDLSGNDRVIVCRFHKILKKK